MERVVVVDAVRTPTGRRGGNLSGMHPGDMLGASLNALIQRSGIDPAIIGQVVNGTVTKVGAQAANIGRTAWLAAGLPLSVPVTTVDTQCGSSQQAVNFATSLIASGVVDVAVACGVESMSRVSIGADAKKEYGQGIAIPKTYFAKYEFTSQFEGAERIARKWGITREDCDEFGCASQNRANQAWQEDRFGRTVIALDAPVLGDDGKTVVDTRHVTRDEGLRDTNMEGLAKLKVTMENGVHTAGSSSQIADGSGAVLLMSESKAASLGLTPRAAVVDTCLVGVDPVLMLTGPIDATQLLLERNKLSMADIDVVEINEAFASVVLAWQRELGADLAKTNPNGGAIAMGHPLGGTGCILTGKAVDELHRTGGRYALVTMCCGGGLGTGTLLERL